MNARFTVLLRHTAGMFLASALFAIPSLANNNESILKKLKTVDTISSTVPANGDINPYGIVRVPHSIGNLREGHYLVSNFNASSNLQGTGTTIVDVSPTGALSLFAELNSASLPGPCPGGVGLTTALAVLRTGWVIVGSLPTSDGSSATAQAGCLIVLDSWGTPVETIQGSLINGPWDMTSLDDDDHAVLFVTNVLNGTVAANGKVVNQGTVLRVNLRVSEKTMPFLESLTIIGAGFAERTDPAALVIGPTGVGLSASCNHGEDSCESRFNHESSLFVADSLNNRVVAIRDPLGRTTPCWEPTVISTGGSLNDPLGLTVSPGGNILVVNGNDGFVTEITPHGTQIANKLIDNSGNPPGAGALFGLIYDPERGLVFVDDATNTLNVLH